MTAAAVPAPVAILGMHRSGTSCLAGCLQEAGLFLGDVNTQARYNARGNRENRRIMDLHDAVLAANGGRWDRPVADIGWDADLRARRDELIAGYPAGRAWGFKDPRSLLCLDFWREAIQTLRLVGTFRHPAAVAASLGARAMRVEVDAGLALWHDYNSRLLAVAEQEAVPLVCFDWAPARYRQRLDQIVAGLGLEVPAAGYGFFDEDLRHQPADEAAAVPETAVALHRRLLALADAQFAAAGA